jgi:hypothetical protein
MQSMSLDLEACPMPEALMAAAAAHTGLDDFGDPARHAGLRAFISSLEAETWRSMTDGAREVVVDYLLHHLGTRLRLINDRKEYPQIAQQRIQRPLIIVGPPRSGSTLLHTLLSLDPDNMAPEHWMCREPSPPLARGAPSPARIERAQKRMMQLFGLIPDIFVTHPYMIEEGAGALAECGSDILNMVSTSQEMWCFWGGEIYRRYLLEADHTAALSFHHDFLQHLQWGNSGTRWVLKGSEHGLWLRELIAQYPDARLIWTHRDLAQQLGSLASVQAILRGLNGHPVTPEVRRAQGRLAIEHQAATCRKAMAARDEIGEAPFIDVSYHDVMADPVRSVARIYQLAGLSMSHEHVTNIRGWLARNPQTKHGKHKHSPDEFGMDGEAINREFEAYRRRFGFGFGIRPELTV